MTIPRRALALLTAAGLTLAFPGVSMAQDAMEMAQQTERYSIVLLVGPMEQMLTPEEAATATDGEVMVPTAGPQAANPGMDGMAMAGMGMPALDETGADDAAIHHVEAHIYDLATGSPVSDAAPLMTITDQASGITTQLSPVMAMYGIDEGPSDLHYGNNAYLPPGTYTILVAVGGDVAVFPDVTMI